MTCIHCGATNYPASLGGPNICPSCDCGNFGPDKMQTMRLAAAEDRIREMETELAEARAIIAGRGIVERVTAGSARVQRLEDHIREMATALREIKKTAAEGFLIFNQGVYLANHTERMNRIKELSSAALNDGDG